MASPKIAATSTDLLFARLESAREQTDAIFDLIDSEALYSRPIPERHRLIFYLGHLEAFDWNCPQHITPRYAIDEVQAAVAPLQARVAQLETENQALRAEAAAYAR